MGVLLQTIPLESYYFISDFISRRISFSDCR